MGPSSPSQKGVEPSRQFSAHVYCRQTAGWIKMALGMEVGLGPGHIVIDVDPAPPPQKGGRAPDFLAHFYCGQMAGCIKSYRIVSHCECKQLPLYAHIYVRNIINDTITLRITSTSSSKEWCFKVIHNILVKPKLM